MQNADVFVIVVFSFLMLVVFVVVVFRF